ncbi:Dam family site-specific DNA-(adenine-N6)-methyltransferase [Kosakonia sp. S58]|uniref:Dam family site-specific DNA-(adenine-N6)-methyltransferase n=1 Tax=unclassified Kosakonia TaxID=2632876 RepID=UPI001903BB52|nr:MULTISPECIES: Dam family site-specific DNA-(adenine-N6)-methyltransferase [unclassified Kosakonia]MBK0080104.1 Dam family site-specific DNA-(adenine-N6)-methyltransferase [Kosakonia sp. S57]MBK0086866.1 Dam family site-specific DNA-(adenine-N6)-methyltransferase [Kosakonia sp. S58]
MRYGSVCSGIEAATVAWAPLGWKAAWFAEIEKFPSAVLAARWPEVSNLGDMTKIAAAVRAGEVEAPDVLVGGTPCQAFSIAGLRNGLADARGQLTLSYVELADAIDDKRREAGEEEAIIVWENVPGVLSSKDNAFGCFLAGLAGEDEAIEPGDRPAAGKSNQFWRWSKKAGHHIAAWPQRGCVYGPQRALAWVVRDAQYFGVAQRRKRVFVVASARTGFDPAEVLFEFDGVRRDSAPRRESQPEIAGNVGECFKVGSHWDNPANPHPTLNQSNNIGGIGTSNQEIFSQRGSGLVSNSYADLSRTLLGKENDSTAEDLETYVVHGTQDPDVNRELAHTLGRNNGQENACIAFSYKDHGADASFDLSPTMRAGNHDTSHANSGQPPAIAYAFKAGQGSKAGGIGYAEEQAPTLTSASSGTNLAPAICIQHASIGRHDSAGPQGKGFQEDVAFTQDSRSSADVVQFGMQVRRLTPVECERLQGFPDDHTLIAWRGKGASECPDGPRYKAIGNSMAVPVMRWIGERIAAGLPVEKAAPRAWQRPFLKWAGGKYSLMPELDSLIPAGARLVEPFVGGGSVFLNLAKYERFLLADANPDLINLYQMLAVVPEQVTVLARQLFAEMNDEPGYFAVRQAFNAQQMTGPERAAAFLYLNRHCFNGLIRYNRAGEFNVGWGKKANPYFPDKELLAFAAVAPSCVFMNAGYRRTLSLAGEGDVVYCDPPYEPLPGTAGFTNYAAGGFAWADQVALAESCVAAHQRGARVVISNSTAPRIIELYEQHCFTLHHVSARRSISSKASTRENAADIVAIL